MERVLRLERRKLNPGEEPRRKRRKNNMQLNDESANEAVQTQDGSSSTTGVPCDEVEVGNIVACYLRKYENEEPQLGVVRSLMEKKAVVAWMAGDYDDYWAVFTGKNGKEWTEKVPYSST